MLHAAPSTRVPLQVLVADPDAESRVMYRQHIFGGCDVLEAAAGRDALEKALVRAASLVLTELFLPMLDGFALCDILRQDRMTAETPIVVVTSETRATEWSRAFQAGADAVLIKKTPLDALLH